jgi:hypothetical protein
MLTEPGKFEIVFRQQAATVEEINVSGRNIFVVRLSGQNPLVITRSKNAEGERFWTCIPEHPDRQKLAIEIGQLIELYLTKAV